MQALTWSKEGHEEGLVVVSALRKVAGKVNLGASIKIHLSLLVSLACYDTLAVLEVNILSVELYKFSYTHTRRGKQVYHGQVTTIASMITHLFKCLVRIGFLDRLTCFHLVDASHRTLHDVVLILKPSEEAGEYATDIVNCHLAGTALLLIVIHVVSQIIGCDVRNLLVYLRERIVDGTTVVCYRIFRTALNALG